MFIVNPYVFSVFSASYLLDLYPATAAYSLRKLSSTATNAIRVRRSSDSAEQDIGFSGDDLDTASLSSFVGANSGYVVKWYNQGTGSSTYDASQTTAANQPRIVNAGTIDVNANGNPKIVFDGSNDNLSISALIPQTATDIWGFLTSYQSSGNYGIVKDAGATTWGWRQQGSSSAGFDYHDAVITNNTPYQSTKTILSGEKILVGNYDRNAEIDIWVNSSIGTSATPPSTNLRGTTGDISIGYTAGATAVSMETSEWILFLSDQTANRTAIESDINSYYNLYWDGSQNGLFDTYPATAGYSLRNLSSSYTGPLIRVRRSSDNAEQDIYGTYNGDLNTASLSSFVGANSGYVVKWYNQGTSGATYDMVQSTAANQPRIVNAGTIDVNSNGNPKMVFDGSNDGFLINALISETEANIWSFLTSYQAAGNYGIVKDAGAATWGWRHQGSSSASTEYYSVITTTPLTFEASKAIVTGEKISVGNYDRNAEIEIYVNSTIGTSATPNNANLRTSAGNVSFGRTAGDTAILMETSEWILFLSDESANRTAIETNINSYYSIY